MENYIVVGSSTQNAKGFQRQNKTHELDKYNALKLDSIAQNPCLLKFFVKCLILIFYTHVSMLLHIFPLFIGLWSTIEKPEGFAHYRMVLVAIGENGCKNHTR